MKNRDYYNGLLIRRAEVGRPPKNVVRQGSRFWFARRSPRSPDALKI
jgi:hypothetical protein